uniref:Uncharacterized protein n=1 Tax=Knufia peltigerae TaxID=1002370 RepID=A0AA38XXU1_9EURO|nr:hypothetical protein H2204_010152 [Knufia peltigerae]
MGIAGARAGQREPQPRCNSPFAAVTGAVWELLAEDKGLLLAGGSAARSARS